MTDDLFIRSLEGAGLAHDVDLFVARFRSAPGEYRLAIIADAPDEAASAEATIPALRYLRREGIGVVIVSGAMPSAGTTASSFADRLTSLGALEPAGEEEPLAIRIMDFRGGNGDPPLLDQLVEIGCRKILILDAQGIVFRGGEPLGIVTPPPPREHGAWLAEVDGRQRQAAALGIGMAAAAEERGISVSLASPINMLAELFTVRGSGTLFRPEASFQTFQAPDAERERALREVVERAFGRPIVDPAFTARPGARGILEGQARAAALIIPTPLGDYMSKFAVVREAQGTGIGAELWQEICNGSPKLFWRSRKANPINGWYARIAEGMIRDDYWTFFWRGLSIREAESARRHALALPEDFPPIEGN